MEQTLQTHLEIIVKGSAAYKSMVCDIATEVVNGILKAQNPMHSSGSEWLSLAEAKQILHFASKKKWKFLRDNGEIEFSRIGMETYFN